MKTYTGIRTAEGALVRVIRRNEDGVEETTNLDPRLDVRRYSLVGFDWGRIEGGGCTQLALALMCDALVTDGDQREADQLARTYVFAFEEAIVERLDVNEWTLTQDQVLEAVAAVADASAKRAADIRAQQVATEQRRLADEQRARQVELRQDAVKRRRAAGTPASGTETMTLTGADVGTFDLSDEKGGA